jgi:YcaO-like protein with predicted kinase domain
VNSAVSHGDAHRTTADTVIAFRAGTDRSVSPSRTLERIAPIAPAVGITRVATLTGLDRIGLPVVSVCRPNSRSLSVAQGKGVTLEAARASGLMESIELYHAEHIDAPLRTGSYREMRRRGAVADHRGLPRLTTGEFHEDRLLHWIEGFDLIGGVPTWVPYELVHTDYRRPALAREGAFMMSSNGLASGNCLVEATSHAVCELVERDGNTLFGVSSLDEQERRKLDLTTVDDPLCRDVLARYADAGVRVVVWETTTDVGIPSFLCTVVEGDQFAGRPMPPVSGSGCHARRAIALLRALTEAAQGRLTIISGARDDLRAAFFDERGDLIERESPRLLSATVGGSRAFGDAPTVDHQTLEGDVRWELQALVNASFTQAIAVDLTKEEFDVPVVRVIIPYLEAMSEVPGYVLGRRARRAMEVAAR